MIILDTNVISELIRAEPFDRVTNWFLQQPFEEIRTTAITEAELFYGVGRMSEGKKKPDLEGTLERIFKFRFRDRVLPFDSAAARNFADVGAILSREGRSFAYADLQIASIARSLGATVATRDEADFQDCGIRVINPWTA